MSVPAPFYNSIKGTTAGAAGTGAFTPNAASTGFRAWTNVPTGWIGMVRFEDGSAWELTYSYWNGTTLSRASTQVFDSSTGSALTLTSSATASLICEASEVMSHVGGVPWRGWTAQPAVNGQTALGLPAPTVTGSSGTSTIDGSNYQADQPRHAANSLTTANAQAGWSHTNVVAVFSTTAGRGGAEFVCRFGASQLPTGPRAFVGLTSVTMIASTGEPSALVGSLAVFAKDSTDTNFQLLTNDNAGGGNKSDTGIAWAANGWYEACIWWEPGGARVYGLLIRLDTGAIWYGSTVTQLPANGALLFPQAIFGLSATTGTALNARSGGYMIRGGS